MPFTGFWNRWRQKQLPPYDGTKPPRLHDAERQRDAAEQQSTEESAAIATRARLPITKGQQQE